MKRKRMSEEKKAQMRRNDVRRDRHDFYSHTAYRKFKNEMCRKAFLSALADRFPFYKMIPSHRVVGIS